MMTAMASDSLLGGCKVEKFRALGQTSDGKMHWKLRGRETRNV
jgi:hypothetical protein